MSSMTHLRQQLIRSLAIEGVRPQAVRTLSDVLSDIAEVGPAVWSAVPWNADDGELSYAIDRLDELQAEARALIEATLGLTWDQIQGANL